MRYWSRRAGREAPGPRCHGRRAVARAWRDRGNYSAGVSFSTTRKFDSLTEAEEFAATYDLVYPRTGYLEFYGAAGAVVATLYGRLPMAPFSALGSM